jgi:hypothetical protein
MLTNDPLDPSGAVIAEHVVYFAVYNPSRFRSKIESWLPRINLTGTHLVIADNHSTDNSLLWISVLTQTIDAPVSIIRNDHNLGGYGGFAANLWRFKDTTWITTLHQDDSYSKNHIQEHRKVLSNGQANLGMVCSEARSISPSGRVLPYPRAHWLLDSNPDLASVFLANLKQHVYPFSGATFRRELFERYPVPWYSSAFPDTEMVLRMCADYACIFAKGITVEYLENPISESHSLSAVHREFGAFQSLIRVFSGASYEKVCRSVNQELRDGFIEGLMDGLRSRFENSHLRELITQVALERAAEHMGPFQKLNSEIAKGYISINDLRAVEVLSAMGAHLPKQALSAQNIPTKHSVRNRSAGRLLIQFLRLIPGPMRKTLFQKLMKTEYVKTRLNNWNFDWKNS